jgi:hypothetical protein
VPLTLVLSCHWRPASAFLLKREFDALFIDVHPPLYSPAPAFNKIRLLNTRDETPQGFDCLCHWRPASAVLSEREIAVHIR